MRELCSCTLSVGRSGRTRRTTDHGPGRRVGGTSLPSAVLARGCVGSFSGASVGFSKNFHRIPYSSHHRRASTTTRDSSQTYQRLGIPSASYAVRDTTCASHQAEAHPEARTTCAVEGCTSTTGASFIQREERFVSGIPYARASIHRSRLHCVIPTVLSGERERHQADREGTATGWSRPLPFSCCSL